MKNNFEVVRVDFRDQLVSKSSPFYHEVNSFITMAVNQLNSIKDAARSKEIALAITNNWLDLLDMRDVVDLGYMPKKTEMAQYTGMSIEEVLLLEATAYAEALGLEITPLEQSAAAHNIYGSHFPGRSKAAGIANYPYRGNLNGDAAP